MYRISNVIPPVALPTHFVVYFDVKSSMPIAWKQYDEQDHLVDALEVTAEQAIPLPAGGWYVAPKQTRLTNFEYQNPKSIGTEINTWTFDYTDISTVPDPEESFRLDPAKARWIRDEDTHREGPPSR